MPCSLSTFLWAQDDLSIIAVGEAERIRERIFIAPILRGKGASPQSLKFAKSYDTQLSSNFAFYRKFFQVVKTSKSYLLTAKNFSAPNYRLWPKKTDRYLIHSRLSRRGKVLGLRVKAFDLRDKKEIYSERFVLSAGNNRGIVHSLCDSIYRSFTGRPSIFGSRIVFVSDYQSTRRKTIKELYIMDFDGHNIQRLTNHLGIVISPSIGPDRNQVIYSLIRYSREKRNVNLRILNLRTKRNRLFSSSPGLNSGAVFAPNGKSIYLTMSHQGNAEIYNIDLHTRKTQRITRHRGEDVDPSIDATGRYMAFLSDRPGRAMIYIGSTLGTEKEVRRISHTGKFNATPRFAPNGLEMAFASWVDNRFDIYRVSVDGNELVRLTRNFGSNESPSYSRDGQFIVFTSQRVISRKRADQNLYIMDRDGEILGAITKNFGKCLSPRWSN